MSASGWSRSRPEGRRSSQFTETERKQVFRAKGQHCYLCGNRATEIDHVVCVAEGGAHSFENAAPICTPCHKIKTKEETDRGQERRRAKLRLPLDEIPLGDKPL